MSQAGQCTSPASHSQLSSGHFHETASTDLPSAPLCNVRHLLFPSPPSVPIQPSAVPESSLLGAPTSPQPLSVSPGIPTNAYIPYQPQEPQQGTYPEHPVQAGFEVPAAAAPASSASPPPAQDRALPSYDGATSQGAYNASASQGAYNPNAPPQGQYQSPPQGQYIQGAPQGAYNPNAPPQGQYNASGPPQGAYNPNAPPQGQYNPGAAQGQYNPAVPPQGQFNPPPPNASAPVPGQAPGQASGAVGGAATGAVAGAGAAAAAGGWDQTQAGAVQPVSGAKGQVHVDKVKGFMAKHGGKNGVWLGNQVQTQVNALATVPIVGDINSDGPPTDYHVFKAGGLFSKDDCVTGADKNNVLYYLDFPRTWRSSWNLTLRHQGKNGPLVATLNKGSYGFTANDIEIVMANGWKTVLAKPSLISKNHEFVGFDGVTSYKWKGDGMLSSSQTLVDLSSGKVAAVWQASYALYKDGSLKINPKYMYMQDLIVATALAQEEWRREESEKGGKSKTDPMNLARMGMSFLKK